MVEDNKEYLIEELKDRITDLEKQNNALSDQVEETILFNFISESFDSINNNKELIEALLEKISILKSVSLCYCIEIKARSINVLGSYCAYDHESNNCITPLLSRELIKKVQELGVVKITFDQIKTDVFKNKLSCKIIPYEIVLIHFFSHDVKNGIFVFISDADNKEVFDDLFIFHQFVKIVTEKWERLGLILQLKKLNQLLEKKVKDRTIELTRLNNMLFKEIQTHQNTNHELNIERKKFHQLFQKANDAIYLWEMDGVANIKRCMEVNQAAIDMTGYSYDELMNMTPSDLMVKGMKNQLKPFLEELEVNEISKMEVVHQRKDGSPFHVEVNSHLFTLDEKKVVLSISRNITERKKIEQDLIDAKEQAEESDRLKSSFLANMSHEIRTPLNAICGFTELIKEDNLEMNEVKDFADIILNNSSHLLNLINDLVDFSKIEAGYVKPLMRPVNISHLLGNLKLNVQSLLYNYKKEHINIIIESSDELEDKLVLTDEVQLRQILSNLLNNSVKYTRKGSITLKTSIVKDQIRFIVSDTGIGIPKKFHEKIFERFVQVKDKKTFSIPGTGLGLAICVNLAEMLNGEVKLLDSSMKGTSFSLTIPYDLSTK